MSDYLPIKEIAKLANISEQAIYPRLKTNLSKYLKEVDNKKMLHKRVLDEVFNVSKGNSLDSDLSKTLQVLTSQLEIKDRQIEELNARLAEVNQLVNNSQQLVKQLQEKPLLIEEKPSNWLTRLFNPHR